MNYCILEIKKIHNLATLQKAHSHNYRTINVPNANPELANANRELVPLVNNAGLPCSYLEAFREKIKSLEYYKDHKIRKNNVRAIEVMTTFSRESRDTIDLEKWEQDNVEWLRSFFNKEPEKFGDNVISVQVHDDENGNIHCHAVIVPIDETGKLSADKYTGNRKKMRDMQDSYAKAMEPYGLQRGVKKSSARHEDISKFYSRLNEKMEVPEIIPGETAIEFRNRMISFVQNERANNMREVMELDRSLRRERDIEIQREMKAVKGAAHAEKASLESECSHLKLQLQNNQMELKHIQSEIQTMRQSYENEKLELHKKISAMNAKAKELSAKMGKLEQAKIDLDAYRYQRAVLDFARQNMPLMAEDVDRYMAAFIHEYESMERDPIDK